MRIISVRVAPLAGIGAITYTAFGLIAFFVYAVGRDDYLTLPIGVLAPLFRLNVNLNLARSTGVLYNTFLCVCSVVAYALTGWITGAVGACCFNIIAKQTGGIDAKYVVTVSDDASGTSVV